MSATLDGLECVAWIKRYRSFTGAGLKQAKDAWDAATSLPGYPCTIAEADFEKSTVTLQMTGSFRIGAGAYRLVPVES